jgi:hypothetical protein
MTRPSTALERVLIAGTALAAFTLAGCSESTSSPTRDISPEEANLSQTPDVIDPTGRHVFHTKTWFENQARDAKPGSGTTTNTGIYYHGGKVLQAGTKVVAIYWSTEQLYNNGPVPGTIGVTGSGSQDNSVVGKFLSRLGGSSYFKINTTYTDAGGKAIQNVVQYTGFWANPASAPTGTQNVSDNDMVAMLQAGFDSKSIAYDSSTVYAIFTKGAVNLGGGYTSPPQYCAYHYHGTVTIDGQARTVLYAAMPYNYQYKNYCTSGYGAPNGDPAADAEVNTLAHEIEEATTDALGTAWFDHRGYENADKCAWTWGTTFASGGGTANVTMGGMSFLVQRNWLNSGSGGCSNGI